MEEKKLIFDEEFLRSGEGGYVFLSHSHKDIEDVRTIRNVFEQKGFEPLCFFLKCLSDDDEVEDLIKREIDARDFFVYVDSKNAQNSRWVRTEREYVKNSGKNENSIFRINLDDFKNNQQSKVYLESEIERIVSSKRVFILCASEDREIAYKISKALEEKDFKVWIDSDIIMQGSQWEIDIEKALLEASKYGYIIPIVSKNSTRPDSFVRREIVFARELGAKFIPIRIDDTIPPLVLMTYSTILLRDHSSEEQINSAVEKIEQRMKY